jgi:hypothetical protein
MLIACEAALGKSRAEGFRDHLERSSFLHEAYPFWEVLFLAACGTIYNFEEYELIGAEAT